MTDNSWLSSYSKKILLLLVQVFKAETGEKLLEIKAHEDEVLCCAFSADDRFIATCSVDKKVKVGDYFSLEL